MLKLELSKREAMCLQSFIENHNKPCEDCSTDIDCGVYKRGICVAKNVETILGKIKALVGCE